MWQIHKSHNQKRSASDLPGVFAQLPDSWVAVLAEELQKPYIERLADFVENAYRQFDGHIYPPKNLIFNAFEKTPFAQVKVVIMGQDPYHGPQQAHGLCFSVPEKVPKPPSLQNIFKELHNDLNLAVPKHGNLEVWARQGVLLLNAILTVRQGVPLSHKGQGWELFTDAVIRALAQRPDPVLFVLWGGWAEKKYKQQLSTKSSACFLVAAHPSPLSAQRGYFGCKHFSKINRWLEEQGKTPIDWRV